MSSHNQDISPYLLLPTRSLEQAIEEVHARAKFSLDARRMLPSMVALLEGDAR